MLGSTRVRSPSERHPANIKSALLSSDGCEGPRPWRAGGDGEGTGRGGGVPIPDKGCTFIAAKRGAGLMFGHLSSSIGEQPQGATKDLGRSFFLPPPFAADRRPGFNASLGVKEEKNK